MSLNWDGQVARYGGSLIFTTCEDQVTNTTYGQITIPLFIKTLPVPVRRPKITEVNTIGSMTGTMIDGGLNAAFYGTPEPLVCAMSGWLITPRTSNQWDIKDDTGTSMNLPGVSMPDLILAYISGRMDREFTGKGYRKDPAAYTDPYGNVYFTPIIQTFESEYTVNYKKQTFSMTLWLEDSNGN